MDCGQGTLKGGLWMEMAADEFFAGDDLFVDELLDFSHDFSEAEGQQLPAEPEEKKSICLPKEILASPENFDLGPLSCGELNAAPSEGLESLEWLSHFVEDSFSDYSLDVKPTHATAEFPFKTAATVQEQRCFTAAVQTKARTKRARNGMRVWPVFSSSVTESSTSSSSSTYSTMSFSHIPVQWQTAESILGKKKKPAVVGGALAVQARRCSHCGVTKTPQWRAGPLGSKTLCNACGVRFKSGRLLPEYRPACSPTFSSEIHSNNHRKVLEMRRQKDSEMETAGLVWTVRSF